MTGGVRIRMYNIEVEDLGIEVDAYIQAYREATGGWTWLLNSLKDWVMLQLWIIGGATHNNKTVILL